MYKKSQSILWMLVVNVTMSLHCLNRLVFIVAEFPLILHQLKAASQALVAQVFRPGTTANHLSQARIFVHFCQHYHIQFLNTSTYTLCYYTSIIFLTWKFISPTSVRNYVSGIRFLHKEIGLTPTALDSFPLTCLLRAENLTMRTSPHQHLHILTSSSGCASSPVVWGI